MAVYSIPGGSRQDQHFLASWSLQPEHEVKQISPLEAYSLMQSGARDLIVLDVRTPEEYDSGHLSGAIILDYYSEGFRMDLKHLDKGKRYLVCCLRGIRGEVAAEILSGLGFRDVYNISGGLNNWESEGLPVIT